jgi:peroxiredoxin
LQRNLRKLQLLDAEVVAFSSHGAKDTQNVVDALDVAYPMVPGPSPKVFRGYGVLNPKTGKAVPAVFIVDKAGMLRWQWIGADSGSRRPSIDAILEKVTQLP